MIQIGDITFDLSDPATLWPLLAAAGIVLLVLWLLIAAASGARRSMGAIEHLARGQERLAERLQATSDGQAQANLQIMQTMELRLSEVQGAMGDRMHEAANRQSQTLAALQERLNEQLHVNALKQGNALSDLQERMNEQMAQTALKQAEVLAQLNQRIDKTLAGNAEKTTESLTKLQERLATIDKAQTNIEKLSSDVLGLQDILSNKQRRGMFGEIQLNDIVSNALPSDSYALQTTLSNGKRADCLILLPNPPGPIVIDAKFPLEAYEALTAADTPDAQRRALRDLAAAVRVHLKAISEKYIIEGETADGALMFLPSEAIYAELHARLPEVIREGFHARVWIVSPTTCMATLNTMRAVMKDARMREQAGEIRKALKHLHRDVEIIEERAGKLETHLRQAGDDVSGILTATARAGKRAERLDNFDFEELSPDRGEAADLVKLPGR
ncbi:DNA recombination protein RmuC [Roseibacterium elongatum DSM 19469]|uniref:DNA recombination protein RmuC homolog n=1 Tax=Roseicyclus elongatus DSM 19469 TaxID=1294273 RepID=W8RQ96_9RHOB|nr:DNA recombination protein RmuC [Roseibacterium elongatum]AHM03238.1 DNA recombination protein RmuC [Roseibacterium elongatum DSM 19469]